MKIPGNWYWPQIDEIGPDSFLRRRILGMGGGYTNKIRIYSVSAERQEGVGETNGRRSPLLGIDDALSHRGCMLLQAFSRQFARSAFLAFPAHLPLVRITLMLIGSFSRAG